MSGTPIAVADETVAPSVLWKAFDVLNAFSQQRRVLTFTEIVRRSGLPKSTTHRILSMLLEVQAVERAGNDYKVGFRMFTVGAVSADARLRDVAMPHLERLRRMTRQTVHLAVLRDGDAIYLEKLPSLVSPPTPALVSGRIPADRTGVGKALLAFTDQPPAGRPRDVGARRPSRVDHHPRAPPAGGPPHRGRRRPPGGSTRPVLRRRTRPGRWSGRGRDLRRLRDRWGRRAGLRQPVARNRRRHRPGGAIFTHQPRSIRGYYNTVVDARLSDYIETGPMLARFLRVNQRHHCVAVIAGRNRRVDPVRTRVQHLKHRGRQPRGHGGRLRADGRRRRAHRDARGPALERPRALLLLQDVVRLRVEIGWNPLLITPEREDTWKPNNYVGISLWEHTLMGSTVVSRLQAFATMATRSIRYQEPSVPELDGGLAPEGRERELARTD